MAKRVFKIIGIVVGSIIGVAVLAVCTALWVVFTPKRLTPIVQNIAREYVTCEHYIGDVELTFFSTFPEFCLHVDSVCVLNPCEGASSDTVLTATGLQAVVDVMALVEENRLQISSLSLRGAEVYAFVSEQGSNFDVLRLEDDTTATDTSSFVLPFSSIAVDELYIEANRLEYEDLVNQIVAGSCAAVLRAHMNGWDDVKLSLQMDGVSAQVGATVYADNLSLGLELPVALDLDLMSVDLKEAQLRVNQYVLGVDGIVTVADELSMQLRLQTQDWQIKPFLALLPASVTDMLEGIDVDGLLSLDADVAGVYNEQEMPVVDVSVVLKNAQGAYQELPYTLRGVNLMADAHVDLNNTVATDLTIHHFAAKTKHSSVTVTGKIDELMGDMRLGLEMGLNAYLPDFEYFVPENIQVSGRAKGQLKANIKLSDLMEMNLDGGDICGDIRLQDMRFSMDSLRAICQQMDVAVQLSGDGSVINAQVGLSSSQSLNVDMDTIHAYLQAPIVHAQVAYDIVDTTAIPSMIADVQVDSLYAAYGGIYAELQSSKLDASLMASKRDKSMPRLQATLQTMAMQAQMDSSLRAVTGKMNINATARYNPQGENVLLQWNPRLEVDLEGGEIEMAALPYAVRTPKIDFTYSNRVFHIEESQVQIGNSDFALSGEVRNMGKWMREQGDLQGELTFVSHYTDVNQFMDMFSADTGSEEPAAEVAPVVADSMNQSEPFMVPLHMDLALNTHIEEAVVFDETVKNLKGKLYVKNGMLVLEEMGFICNAAKLQLTAMYRTPRRNHIYVGLDYHMLDVDIEELIDLLPQLDTIMPMLDVFKGNAEFHLAAETYLNADYEVKPSTLRGACSLVGKDLVVLDNATFSKISKLLMFNKKTENKVDSIAAEITMYKKEIDVYPLCVSIDNYMVALGGRHNLDMTFNYDINVLSPIYLGVNVSGDLDNLDIKLAKCKYAKDFRPVFHGKVDEHSSQLRSIIRESMRKNVKIQ